MVDQSMVMYEEEFKQISSLCERLTREANAKAVLLVDKNGQFITSHGEVANLDTTSLASLTAGSVAATGGLANGIEKNSRYINIIEPDLTLNGLRIIADLN